MKKFIRLMRTMKKLYMNSKDRRDAMIIGSENNFI